MLKDSIVITKNRAMARSYAKINLTLDITGTREDGYHTLETIMTCVNLSDIVIVDKTNGEIKITSNKKNIPTNNKNIAYKACEEFYKALGCNNKGAKILLHKNIPVSAGLAGGSGNAAATLVSLNMLYNNPFSFEELSKIGAGLGADVPFCMNCNTHLATGIGDILTPVSSMPNCYIVLVTPPFSVSTPWVYKEYDKLEKSIFPDNKKMLDALKKKDYHMICDNLSNVLESVTLNAYPVLKDIKARMLKLGADASLMSGSGPTIFGLFDDYKKAKTCHDEFSKNYKDVFLTTCL